MIVPRLRVVLALSAVLAASAVSAVPAHAATSPFKLALIVGPMGSETSGNRSDADELASEATALGVTVAKAYSPNATYAKVRAAVAGANVVVYFGHGNGYPNPYGNNLLTDRVDGWGLNTTTTHGDQDSWSNGTMVYCGEKALEGKLTSSDGSAQRTYCSGGAIKPAAGFVMVYVGSCYSAGSNEPQNPQATTSEAVQHAAYYSRPMITTLGASGYFAGRSKQVVMDLLSNPDESYGDIWNADMPSGITAAYGMAHPLVSGAQEWLTHQTDNPWWYYAFAGDPSKTLNGGTSTFTPPLTDLTVPAITAKSPAAGASDVLPGARISVTFNEPVSPVTASTVTLWHGTTLVPAFVAYDVASYTATITPGASLGLGASYAVKVSANIVDAANHHLAYTTWSFRVATSLTFVPARQAALGAGSHTGYRFSSTGAVLSSKVAVLAAASSAPVTKEAVITGRSGYWLYISAGIWAGYWMQASSSVHLI